MVQFGKIIGSKGEFSATLETKLQNFQEGSDYYIYNEASGRVRKKHYVICSERPVENLRKIN